jgi:hypothetical protein
MRRYSRVNPPQQRPQRFLFLRLIPKPVVSRQQRSQQRGLLGFLLKPDPHPLLNRRFQENRAQDPGLQTVDLAMLLTIQNRRSLRRAPRLCARSHTYQIARRGKRMHGYQCDLILWMVAEIGIAIFPEEGDTMTAISAGPTSQ